MLVAPTAHAQTTDMSTLAAQVVETNPEIEAQREAVRGLEARLSSARSGYFPTAEANGLYQHRNVDVHGTTLGDSSFNPGEVTVEARLRVYDGLRTPNAVQVARAELEAGRAVLEGTISDVLLKLLQTSADVRRDQKVRQYAQMQSDAIAEQLAGTARRLQFGEATATDEYQAKARLAMSRTGILAAEEDLKVSTSAFEAVSGQPASNVPELPRLAPLPPTLEEAIAIARQHSEQLLSAQSSAKAAKQGIDYAKGALAPQVDLVGGYEFLTGGVANLYTGRLPQDRSATYGGVAVRVPIFQGGREYAEIRRTEALYGQRMAQVSATERSGRGRCDRSMGTLVVGGRDHQVGSRGLYLRTSRRQQASRRRPSGDRALHSMCSTRRTNCWSRGSRWSAPSETSSSHRPAFWLP
jgi:outer membrane protein